MIVLNRIETPDGTQITSHYRHDYVSHEDANGFVYSVDGGLDYIKRSAHRDAPSCKELSVYSEDPFEEVREAFLWGTYGKDGGEALKHVALCELTDEHIQAILDTQGHLSVDVCELFLLEQKWRESHQERPREQSELGVQEEHIRWGKALAEMLLGAEEYNSHKVTEFSTFPKKMLLLLCKELEKVEVSCTYIQLCTDMSGSVYQQDYWGEGDHPLGHRDRLLLGVGEIT